MSSHRSFTPGDPLHRALRRYRAAQFAALKRPYDVASRTYRRKFARLFSNSELRRAQEIIRRRTTAYERENLIRRGDPIRTLNARKALRRQVDRDLTRTFPVFHTWRTLTSAHLRDAQRLTKRRLKALTDDAVHIDPDDVAPSDLLDRQEFVPPYAAEYADHGGTSAPVSIAESSFTVRASGLLKNRVAFADAAYPWGFKLIPILIEINLSEDTWYDSSVACGATFKMPKSGRMDVSAALQNDQNRLWLSIRDLFGFSFANVDVEVRLFVAFLQPNGVDVVRTVVGDLFGYQTFGTDVTYSASPLNLSMPYLVRARSPQYYEVGTEIQVLVGCEVHIFCQVNDMEVDVDANLTWHLKKMTVGVVS